MAYEQVADLSADTVVKLGGVSNKTQKPNPTKMEGYYLGSRGVQTQNGPALIHVFQTPKGNVGIWGTKDVNDKLGSVFPGTMALVEYTGKRQLAGGKSLHTYKVSQDKENCIEVATNTATPTTEADADEAYAASTTNSYDEDDGADDAAQIAALAAAERKAKLEALLKKGNKSVKN